MNRCLYCYRELGPGQEDFHPGCSRRIFGVAAAPRLPYTVSEIGTLASEVIRAQTTLTGVQPKLSLDLQPKTKGCPQRFTIVGLWGRYILKPPTERYPHLPELEDITMHLAQAAGIPTVPHSLIHMADGALAYITRRIDRTPSGTKIAMEDMCQVTGRLTEYKYAGSHEQIAKALLRHSSAPLLDLGEFWKQVVFAWITGNSDMHLKNYSLYAPVGGRYSLIPAYDLLPTRLVIPADAEELALTLRGKKSRLRRKDFKEAMTATGLAPKVVDNIFASLEAAVPIWVELLQQSFLPASFQEAYAALLTSQFEKLLRQ